MRAHVEVIDPWEVDLPPGDAPVVRCLALGEVHLRAIAGRAGLVVAFLDQEPPDNGTVVEVARAAAARPARRRVPQRPAGGAARRACPTTS